MLAVDALLDIRTEFAPYLDLQLVAFPQDGYLRAAGTTATTWSGRSTWASTWWAASRTSSAPWPTAPSRWPRCASSPRERGLMVDMHCDESDDPLSRHIETLACHTQRLGLQGRVTGSHLTSMHSMDNYYVSKLIPLMAEAGVHAIANPLINITLQGRHDTYPKRRGMTRVKELMQAGVNVAFGHDCVMDPWYPPGLPRHAGSRAHGRCTWRR